MVIVSNVYIPLFINAEADGVMGVTNSIVAFQSIGMPLIGLQFPLDKNYIRGIPVKCCKLISSKGYNTMMPENYRIHRVTCPTLGQPNYCLRLNGLALKMKYKEKTTLESIGKASLP